MSLTQQASGRSPQAQPASRQQILGIRRHFRRQMIQAAANSWTDDVKNALQNQKAVKAGSRHLCRACQEAEICVQILRSRGQQKGVAVRSIKIK